MLSPQDPWDGKRPPIGGLEFLVEALGLWRTDLGPLMGPFLSVETRCYDKQGGLRISDNLSIEASARA